MLPHFRPATLPMSLQRYLYQSCCDLSPGLRFPRHHAPTVRFYTEGSSYRIPRSRFSPRLLLLAPVAGLTIIYLSPRPQSLLHGFFSSSTIIPCPDEKPSLPKPLLIHSPYEQRPSLWSRILHLLRSGVLERLLTARRFVYLCFLFVPVVITSPMLLIGAPGSGERKRKRPENGKDKKVQRRRVKLSDGEGERWGAVWWYDFMVGQMQKAGPTFIKVGCLFGKVYRGCY
jgi:aarF domain-containing kinase